MRLIALLSWFDERSDWLAELVASMATANVDHVVAIDGSYALYPQAKGSSGSEQATIMAAAALGARMGVTVHVPQWPWIGNEVEKRTAMFALGHVVAQAGEDWLWVCDGDEVITQAAGLRDALEDTALDVAEVMLREGVRQGEHEFNHQPIRKLFRAQPSGIRVEGHHARYVTGDDVVLWDAGRPDDQVEALSYWDVQVRHRPCEREPYRNAKRNSYYQSRTDLATEVG